MHKISLYSILVNAYIVNDAGVCTRFHERNRDINVIVAASTMERSLPS